MKQLKEEIADNWAHGQRKTLIFVYYAGHGVMNNMTHAVCNGGYDFHGNPSNVKCRYNLENSLRILGFEKGGYVVGVFDCTRVYNDKIKNEEK